MMMMMYIARWRDVDDNDDDDDDDDVYCQVEGC